MAIVKRWWREKLSISDWRTRLFRSLLKFSFFFISTWNILKSLFKNCCGTTRSKSANLIWLFNSHLNCVKRKATDKFETLLILKWTFINIGFHLWFPVQLLIQRNKHHPPLPIGQNLYVHQQSVVQGKLEGLTNPNHQETHLYRKRKISQNE